MALEESNKRKSFDEVKIIDDIEDIQDSIEPDTKKLKNENQQHNLKTSEENGEIINLVDDKPSESIKIESDGEIIELDNETTPEDTPFCINIKFKNDAIAELYKAKFIKFINSFIELDAISEDNLSISVVKDEAAKPQDWVVLDEDSIAIENDLITDTPSKKRKNKRSKAKKELFVVDATPSEEEARFDVKYKTKFKINIEKEDDKDKNNEARPQQAKCFNCDQPHQLRDCPNPKNYEKINAARQKIKQQPRASRYHLECAQKFGNVKPGKISSSLRKALGLGRDEIPRHVYLMRKFGYPPGWLKEAKMIHSNIDLFDLNGKNVKTDHEKKKGLDPNNIIDYSGFNAPIEDGTRDDYRRHGVPPYSKDITKEIIMSTYKESSDDEDDYSTDMEIDNDEEDNVKEEQEIKTIQTEEEISRISPSLIDLEEQKNSLLNELNDGSESNEKSSDKSENDKELLAVKTTSFGTPILKSSSPYMTLPNPDNFSKDVSPVINFENLPNSTGKYEQMTDVLHKVRTTLKKIQNI